MKSYVLPDSHLVYIPGYADVVNLQLADGQIVEAIREDLVIESLREE